ncbi:glycosyltransferase [Patescibacteria group bacterium]|nr:glycosyltransferase [Patescibacteria group bacterium]MBU1663524.1 glycosyltransferase [Patescibacteria group bacterium]MBU1933786.1 glycosyltransferase [Patescibacteria group bacterium]MBU2007822.1 glycosyltransferase [Patescibacteria group bacterium]MBU2233428.1 glycosyltransferase [Patescibacteria group bacterium]
MRLYIGFITYGVFTAKYLPYFLPCLKAQTYKDYKIIAIDNSEEQGSENYEYIRKNYSEIDIKWAGKNLGFAKAYNLIINQAIKHGAEYFLALNPDMIFDPKMIENMARAIETDKEIGAAQPKILKWDFEHKKKTNIIDSYGIVCDQKLRFIDYKQGEQGEIEKNTTTILSKEIFGFTGAAAMFKIKTLTDVAFNNGVYQEYFDELMFMYKEDCDLSLRLRLAGWKIVLVNSAMIYHDRTASRIGDSIWKIIKNRTEKKRKIKQWSFFGQWIIVLKYCQLAFSWKTKFWFWLYQLEILTFTVLFEQYLLKELIKLWKLRDKINKRKQQLKVRVDIKEIEKLMK